RNVGRIASSPMYPLKATGLKLISALLFAAMSALVRRLGDVAPVGRQMCFPQRGANASLAYSAPAPRKAHRRPLGISTRPPLRAIATALQSRQFTGRRHSHIGGMAVPREIFDDAEQDPARGGDVA